MSYVTMTHQQHGVTQVYLISEVEANKLNGWVLREEKEPDVPEVASQQIAPQELSLNERYFEKFGKLPHHRLSDKNIKIALEE